LILIKWEEGENSALAQKLLDQQGGALTFKEMLNFDFERLIQEVPFDLMELLGEI